MNGNTSRFAGNALLVGGATLVSRLLGFVRDAAMAWLLGTGPVADALSAALRLPWAVRRLLGEGALSLNLSAACAGRENPCSVAMAVARRLLVPLLVLAGALMLGAPWLAEVLAPGAEDSVIAAMIPLLRLCLPYVPLAVVSACVMAGLHGAGRFGLPGVMPILLNISVIAATLGAIWCGASPFAGAVAVGCGVLVGGVLQWLPGWALWREGHRGPHPKQDEVSRILRALPSGILGAGMAQLAFLLAGVLASLLPEGNMSALFYAERLLEFPLGVLGAAVGMVAAPELRRNRNLAAPVLEWTLTLHLAAAAGLVAVAEPLVRLLFEHGAFDALAVERTTTALRAYCLGLPAYALSRPLLALCHGEDDRFRTLPARSALWGLLVCLAAGGGLLLLPQSLSAIRDCAPALGVSTGLWTQVLILRLHLHGSANMHLSSVWIFWGCFSALAAYCAASSVLSTFGPSHWTLLLAVTSGGLAWLILMLPRLFRALSIRNTK